jgi:pyruvate dehydrogenase E1 component
MQDTPRSGFDVDDIETREWLESLEWVLENEGPERAAHLITRLESLMARRGAPMPAGSRTPYVNSIPVDQEPQHPGNRDIERRIKSIVRWNAMAMVVRANRHNTDVGGHISTYASAATLYEVGFNHFFQGPSEDHAGDQVYFQGHASPGIYARAFVEGRLSQQQLENFRRELQPGGGLSSYPHPWLMPDFWEFPTVSMGLGPIMAIYQARFNRYLEDRGLKPENGGKVWAFIGDGETDEPESLGAISLPVREQLDNLIFVINCNLQRLDGPVRGNFKVIQELEAAFRGAGWNVIKVIWGSDWDPLLAADKSGALIKRMDEVVDGQYQKYSVSDGAFIREDFFGKSPQLLKLVEHLGDEELRKMNRGGHDTQKVYAAYKAAVEHKGSPTVILAKTIKGYGLGESGEGKNITHQQKKLNEEELRRFRTRFGIPINDDDVAEAPFYRPPDDSPEMIYLHERRQALNGYIPARQVRCEPLMAPPEKLFSKFYEGSGERKISTTRAFVDILEKLLRDKRLGQYIVPIVPDEARTFGMDKLFRRVGIYSHVGQLYDPVDSNELLYYKEAVNGQILEEGITEAGSMSSFIAAGTAYATHGINTIPFFIYYSMFGMQRIGDLIWLAGDIRARGFLLGGTAGRTTLNGEGLQHQDGHSIVFASAVPNMITYDVTYAYELAVIIRDGIRRMYQEQENVFYYLTLENDPYVMPPKPDGVDEGILRGIYKLKPAAGKKAKLKAHLFGSGAITNEALKAQEILAEKYNIAADVWSVTSYNELRRDALNAERWNLLHPEEKPRVPFISETLEGEDGVYVAASDYMKTLPDGLRQWIPGEFISLGTDGFGRSETREALRDFFEVDARYIAVAAIAALTRAGKLQPADVSGAIKDLDIDPEKVNPMIS